MKSLVEYQPLSPHAIRHFTVCGESYCSVHEFVASYKAVFYNDQDSLYNIQQLKSNKDQSKMCESDYADSIKHIYDKIRQDSIWYYARMTAWNYGYFARISLSRSARECLVLYDGHGFNSNLSTDERVLVPQILLNLKNVFVNL